MRPQVTVGSRTRAWSYVATGVALAAACVTPVVATGAWLMLTDPGIAADVGTSGDLTPLAWAIVDTLSEALRNLLGYL